MSLVELQSRGICLIKLCLMSMRTGFYGRTVITFGPKWSSKQIPSNGITNGDIVGVSLNNETIVLVSGVVLKVEQNSIDVAFDKDISPLNDNNDENKMFNLIKLTNDVTHRRLKSALNDLKKYSLSHNLIHVLFGETEISTQLNENYNEIQYFNNTLNDSQKEAIKFALNQKEIAIIHGPPGTGKTTTLIELILQCVRNYDLKVLACAPSNVAVDNLLEKLSIAKQDNIVRLGHPARAFSQLQKYSLDAVMQRSDQYQIVCDIKSEIEKMVNQRTSYNDLKSLRKELKQREKKVLKEVFQQSKVVLSTLTSGSPDGPLKQILNRDGYYPFDIVVIDECSQALEAASWIVLNCAHKCILAGDHMQLPPTIISEKAAKLGLEVSLMERLLKQFDEKSIVRMLDIQYRMNKLIMNWSSNVFYSNKLEAFETVSNHTLNDIINECNICPLILIDTAGCDMNELELEDEESKGNEYEADIVSIYVKSLIEKGFSESSIGIISPYNLQVQLLRARLKSYEKVEIKSVDGFQGREKEIIILSLVRSNDKHEVGFLSERRRINVAVTRAKRHLVVVCDSDTVSNDLTIKSLIDHFHENGEIISGHVFIDDMRNLTQTQRPSNLRFKAKECSKTNTEKRIKQKAKQMVNKNVDTKEDDSIKIEKQKQFQEKLETFISTSDCYVLEFPNDLNSFERLLVHQIADSLELIHESVGEGNERHIIVKKKHLSTPQLESISSEVKKINLTQNEQHLESDLNIEKVENSQIVTKEKCNISDNITKNITKSGKTKDHKNEPKVENNKSKMKNKSENKIKSISLPEDDDIDVLIACVKKADNICSYTRCKTNISVLGQSCRFCGHRFCLTHSMPEIHGCGDEVRAFVKSTIRKEGKLYAGSGIPNKKKLDSVKRNYLEKKLSNKLNDMSNGRKTKKSDNKK